MTTPHQRDMLLEAVKPMLRSRLRNYIVPGLTSYLVGGGLYGKVRLFSAERHTREFITPHSHRFDFACFVLKGRVTNTLFTQALYGDPKEDAWCLSEINQVCGVDGLEKYVHTRCDEATFWVQEEFVYEAGDVYRMKHNEIHSIQFEKGSEVLFFEGPPVTTTSSMLEPWVNGKVVPTFKTEDWMFDRSDDVPMDLLG